jgi:rhomboid protease GluP
MKHPYLNTLYTNLILQRDYQPVKLVGASAPQDILILQKYHHDINFLIQLMDGDLLNPLAMETKLKADYEFLLENNSSQVLHMVEIVIFNEPPAEDMLVAIHKGLANHDFVKRFISCFTVNLSEQTVKRQSKASLNTDGLEKLLKTQFKEVNPSYEVLPDISSLLALRKQEYTIEVKVNKPTLTYALIGINIAVFVFFNIYSMMYGHGKLYESMLVDFGAKDNGLILAGQYWRLISPVFLHANPLHLLVNCYSLFVVGNIVERIFGHLKYGMIYFMAGLYGSIASFVFSANPAVGASGAIFGLLGALVYYGVERPKIFKKYFGYNVWVTILINVAIGFSMAGIDNFAHLGGLSGGFLTAYAIKANEATGKGKERYLTLFIVMFIAALAFYYGLNLKR